MNLPERFTEKMKGLLGDEYEAFIKSYEEGRNFGLRVNTSKISPEEFQKIALDALISFATRSPSPLNFAPSSVAFPPGAAQRSNTLSPDSISKREAGDIALGSCK